MVLEKLLLELCSQLSVAWKKLPALTLFRLLKRALPDTNLPGLERFCTSQSNGFAHKWNVNCSPPGALCGDCQVSKGLTDGSSCSLLSWTVQISAASNKHHSFNDKPWHFHKWSTSLSCSFERLLNKNQEGKLWEHQWTFKSYFHAELLTVYALNWKEGLIFCWLTNNVFDRSTVFIFWLYGNNFH